MISNKSEYGSLNEFRPWSGFADIPLSFKEIPSAPRDIGIMKGWKR